jgi:integrase
MVYAAVRYYPALKDHKFGWLSELLKQIPRDSQSEVRERKLRKYVQYDVVAAIPNTIRGERQKLAGVFPKQIARLVRDELLMRWLTILPWRQRNIRECKINVHIYKRELPPMGGIETPRWVQENTRTNLQETFWQFEFRESETKNGERVLGILPRQLVPLLEEYLEHHRPLLLTDSDPGNLFLAKNGAPLDEKGVCELVEDLTVRYARKRVTPHLFRDIFAFKWLQDHPTDYLTLSKHLWHKDVQTTIQCYGFKFDTSHAVCQVEEWLDRRASSVSI